MRQNSLGAVSPRDQRIAAFTHVGSATSLEQPTVMLDGRTVTAGDYLARFPATEFVTYTHKDDLASALGTARDRSCTLDFCIMLFDPDLSLRLKQRAAEELDELLSSDVNRTYALDILLSNPLPKDTDFESAKAATDKSGEAYRVICLLEESRERAEFVFTAWLSVRKHPVIAQIGEQHVRGKLILSGVFRRAATELTTKSRMQEHGGALALDTQQHLDARIVNAFLNQYKTKLPEGVPTAGSRDEVLREPLAEAKYEGIQQAVRIELRSVRGNSTAKQERAVGEVETIARLYQEGKDQNARKYRDELIARQSTENDHSHLVKSLCNIASKCTIGGRYDAAAECLTDAVRYDKGVDSRLFVQLSNLFKDLQKFEEATDCLHKAERLAKDTSERDLINRELARLLVAKGEYREALEAFRRLSDITSAAKSRTSMATLLRKMGDLSASRSIFEEIWHEHKTYQSFAGLAEVNRQTGRLDKAIKKYSWLLTEMEIDDRSSKVYRMSQSSLCRAIGNLDASRLILEQLQSDYKLDASIQLEMAKVLRLIGDSVRSEEFYRSSFSRLHETDQLAAQLYQTALMTREAAATSQNVPVVVLPEFQTLSHCNVVLRRIIEGNLDALRDIPAPVVNPFRIHADFDAVLRYHCDILLGKDVSPVGDVRVNRIRKRGLADLKMTVRALDRRDFDSALHFEQRMCLSVA